MFKVLANRLNKVLLGLVEEYQTGFILGRNIAKGIAIIQEVIHQIRKTRQWGYLLKLDFQKAYNSVN